MHYQFSKLYLGHHILRGLQRSDPIPLHFQSAASSAREAAATIFSMIQENEALRANVVGMPHYFHIMVSFAGHFLLDVCMKYSEQLMISVEDEFKRLSSVLAFFARIDVVPQHPLARMTAGLIQKLSECTSALGFTNVLARSPFGSLEGQYAAARDVGANVAAGNQTNGMPTSFTPFTDMALPTDFLYTDFSDFNFADPQLDFVT